MFSSHYSFVSWLFVSLVLIVYVCIVLGDPLLVFGCSAQINFMEVWHLHLLAQMQVDLVDDEEDELFVQNLLTQIENAFKQ
jgi:hypothetical protein